MARVNIAIKYVCTRMVQVYHPQELGKLKVSKNNLEGLQTSVTIVTITVIFSFVKEITLFFQIFRALGTYTHKSWPKSFFIL